MLRFLVLICFMVWMPFSGNAQDTLAGKQVRIISKDTVQLNIPKGKFQPKPTKALVYSLIIPGAGQIYNRDWWKLPLVYGALGGVGYLVQQNYKEYRRYDKARDLYLEGKPNEFSHLNPNESSLRAARDYYRSNFELSCLGLGVLYALQAIEAYTAAHLKSFDVSDDLSFHPYFEHTVTGPAVGISYTRGFSKTAPLSHRIQF